MKAPIFSDLCQRNATQKTQSCYVAFVIYNLLANIFVIYIIIKNPVLFLIVLVLRCTQSPLLWWIAFWSVVKDRVSVYKHHDYYMKLQYVQYVAGAVTTFSIYFHALYRVLQLLAYSFHTLEYVWNSKQQTITLSNHI